MRIQRIFVCLALAAVAILAVAAPLAAAEPAASPACQPAAVLATASEAAPPSDTVGPALPDDVEKLLTPAPVKRYGMKAGPCTVSVTCPGGVISCSGQTVCYWKGYSPTTGGFVECDGRRTTCQLID